MFRRAKGRLPEIVRSSVVVHTRDEKSIAGVLLDSYPDVLVLARARELRSDGEVIPIDGEILIPRENVSFVQGGVRLDDTRAL